MDFSQVFVPKTFIKIFYDRNFHMDFHTHTNIEIAYIESGKMEISEMNGPTFSCGTKQFMLIKKNQYHRLIPKSDDIKLLVLEIATPDKNLPVDDYIATSPRIFSFFFSTADDVFKARYFYLFRHQQCRRNSVTAPRSPQSARRKR